MQVTVRALTGNKEVMNRCRTTVWKHELDKEPSEEFMRQLYFSEHSPIRDKWFSIRLEGIKSWIATHLSRHNIGFTPYISTQREDRHKSDIPRDELPQGSLVDMEITLNAQSFINVSRKRLCEQSHEETRDAWQAVLSELKKIDRPLYDNCVPNCVYRGGICPEGKNTCRYNLTDDFYEELEVYLNQKGVGLSVSS